MSFGCSAGDFIAILTLAIKVQTGYKDSDPKDHNRLISEEAGALRVLLEKSAQHFRNTTVRSDDYHYGKKALDDCQNVLEDLISLIEKYKRLVPINKRLEVTGVRLGKENTITLRERLILNTTILKGFVQRSVVLDILFN